MKRVLVVPDRLIGEELGSTFFDRHSLTVRTARYASEAAGIARVFRPDLVILRSDLPGVGALELCRSLHAAQPHVRILLVHETIGEQDGDFGDLVHARLVQPLDATQLLTTIAVLLEIKIRRGPRVHIETLVRITGFGLPEQNELSLANSVDISEYGVLLETGTHLELGTQGNVSFFLPGCSERLSLGGVARVALDELLLHYAIEFEDTPDRDRQILRKFVADQLGEPAAGDCT